MLPHRIIYQGERRDFGTPLTTYPHSVIWLGYIGEAPALAHRLLLRLRTYIRRVALSIAVVLVVLAVISAMYGRASAQDKEGHPTLGLELPTPFEEYTQNPGGVPVISVECGGPADLAGITTKDRVLAINGRVLLGLTQVELDEVAREMYASRHNGIVRFTLTNGGNASRDVEVGFAPSTNAAKRCIM